MADKLGRALKTISEWIGYSPPADFIAGAPSNGSHFLMAEGRGIETRVQLGPIMCRKRSKLIKS